MNIHTKNSQPSHIVSKYFNESVLDGSLMDFKESERKVVGPKQINRIKSRKYKTLGQTKDLKDIRTAFKLQKSEIVSDTKQFHNVCKQIGVDVDCEELQIAIALSKSLLPNELNSGDKTPTVTKTSKQQSIHKTLKEYGFKIPDSKVNKKRCRTINLYKLLTLSQSEKQKQIFHKYSLILLQNTTEVILKECKLYSENRLYHLSTNVPYNILKDNSVFYIDILEYVIKPPVNNIGSLLKSWADIPGRPVSPKQESSFLNILELQLTQNDLDIMLSGSLQSAKEILKTYRVETDHSTLNMNICDKNQSTNIFIPISDNIGKLNNNCSKSDCAEIEKNKIVKMAQIIRSFSPDIFDDDDVYIVNNNKSYRLQSLTCNTELSSVMDLTDANMPLSVKSSQDNITKRRSNDFMEMTECAAVSSQPILEDVKGNIKETQNQINKLADEKEIDLTQSSNSEDDTLPIIHLCSTKDKNVFNGSFILDQKILQENVELNGVTFHTDMSKKYIKANSSNSVSENRCIDNCSIFEDYVHSHSDNNIESECSGSNSGDSETIDLTQSPILDLKLETDFPVVDVDSVSLDYDLIDQNNVYKNVENDHFIKQGILSSSQTSEVFVISDDELNYSVQKSKQELKNEQYTDTSFDTSTSNLWLSENIDENSLDSLPPTNLKKSNNIIFKDNISTENKNIDEESRSDAISIETPEHNKYLVKTKNVTPIMDYKTMSTPERNKELEKYGLKPFKRKRAIQLLTHIYNQTHPLIDSCGYQSLAKKIKFSPEKSSPKITSMKLQQESSPSTINNIVAVKYLKKTVKEAVLADVEVHEDWIFQKKEKAKVQSCRVPLHIAFHNYVSNHHEVREAILRYEPVNIDIIHKELVANGYRYDAKDLLKFMDKKCITVKTADGSRNKKH